MRIIAYIILIMLFSCKEKRNNPSTAVVTLPECDTSFIMLSFSDSLSGGLKNGLMAIFSKGVEEDFTSVFSDTSRTFSLIDHDYICLKREELYAKYYVGSTDTLFAALFQKESGYSYPFKIILSEKKRHIKLKWGFIEQYKP